VALADHLRRPLRVRVEDQEARAPHYCLLGEDAPRILLCSDLLMRGDAGELDFVPGQFHDDPAEARRSVERLAELDFDVLCLDHGRPVTADPGGAIEALLAATRRGSRSFGAASMAIVAPAGGRS
jgi:glyoxylase-like metal-dependent hydrolase (beta-lactamase superfamily II)